MTLPIWIRDDVVLAVHERQLAEHGGISGVRDAGLLSSALARPKNLFAYGSPPPDLAALAASYALGIIKNHPFLDGNKRTGYVICRTFLKLNGRDIVATELERYKAVIAVAEGTITEEEFASWIREMLV